MFVYDALQESLKKFQKAAKDFESVDNITELDVLETDTQKLVFELQMQANQVAGELSHAFSNKRIKLQNANAADVMARLRQRQQEALAKVAEVQAKNKIIEEKVDEVKDGWNSNRQRKSNTGNRKPKSSKETK